MRFGRGLLVHPVIRRVAVDKLRPGADEGRRDQARSRHASHLHSHPQRLVPTNDFSKLPGACCLPERARAEAEVVAPVGGAHLAGTREPGRTAYLLWEYAGQLSPIFYGRGGMSTD
jgi:hypothetical protein